RRLPDLLLFLVQNENHSVGIDDRRRFRCSRLQDNRQGDCVNREELTGGMLRTEAPRALLAGLGLLGALGPIVPHMEWIKPGRAAMIGREWRTLAQVRTQPGNRQLAGVRIEGDWRPLQ